MGQERLGYIMGLLLTFAAFLSMIGLFIGNSLGGSRVPFALAEDGMFPTFMVKLHGKFGTPWVAILVVGVIFTIFSWQAFEFLVVADVFLQTLVILAEFAALWMLRFKDPDRPRDRVPGGWLGLILVTLGPTAIILLAIFSQYVEEGWKSIGWAGLPMAMTRSGVPGVFPWGIARPLPIPVVRVESRSRTASSTCRAMESLSRPDPTIVSSSAICAGVTPRSARSRPSAL
ncbi:MAG: APC family permease, partial [Anaerolineales bacterium]|nr:APC family permease [Anaerolineales bacterium]